MILTVLKIIGIILLVILLLIIFILGIILLVPIRYRFSGEYFEQPDVLASVRFNPVGLNAQVSFNEDGLRYTVRMLGGVILTNTGAKLSWLGRKISPEAEMSGDEIHNSTDDKGGNPIDGERTSIEDDNAKYAGENTQAENTQDVRGHAKNSQGKKHKTEHKEKRHFTDIINEKKTSIINKYNEMKLKLEKLFDKKDKLIRVYHSKRFELAKSDVFKYIKELLWVIKPKHVEGRVHFGMEDPATTGEILGGIAVLIPLYEPFLQIVPDFEKQCIEAVLKGYGSIRLVSIVKIGLKVIFNKNLIKVTKRVQTILEA